MIKMIKQNRFSAVAAMAAIVLLIGAYWFVGSSKESLNEKLYNTYYNQDEVYVNTRSKVNLDIDVLQTGMSLLEKKDFNGALLEFNKLPGSVTANYYAWPSYLWMLIFALMFIGGSAGSTGSGVKMIRFLLLIRNSWQELKRSIHPQAIIPVKYNRKSVSQQMILNVMAFFLMYVLVFSAGTILLSLLGVGFETAIGASIATLGNIGPGIGHVGPVDNYAFFPDMAKWVLSFLMLLGRLELFTILIVISPAFWRR